MLKLLIFIILCSTSFSQDESYSEIVFENTPIGVMQKKLKRMKALWKKNKDKEAKYTISHKAEDLSKKRVKTTSKSSFVTNYPSLQYKLYDSFQLDYATSYSTTSNKELYFYGGYVNESLDHSDSHKKMRIFEYKTKSWSSVKVPYPYRVGASLTYLNNKIYIYGGRPYTVNTNTDENPDIRLNDMLIYDISSRHWTKHNIGSARSDHSACVYKGKIYLYGGDAGPTNDEKMLSMEIYNPLTGAVSSTAYSSNRQFHRTLVSDNKLYVIGGAYRSEQGYLIDIKTVEYIDLLSGERDTFEQEFSVTHPIVGLHNNRIVVLGGYRGRTTNSTFDTSFYSVNDERWTHKSFQVTDMETVVGSILNNNAYMFGSVGYNNQIIRLNLKRLQK